MRDPTCLQWPPLPHIYQYVTSVWQNRQPERIQSELDLKRQRWIIPVADGLQSWRTVDIPDYFFETALVNYAIYKLSQ